MTDNTLIDNAVRAIADRLLTACENCQSADTYLTLIEDVKRCVSDLHLCCTKAPCCNESTPCAA